jgi:hypothetical protein
MIAVIGVGIEFVSLALARTYLEGHYTITGWDTGRLMAARFSAIAHGLKRENNSRGPNHFPDAHPISASAEARNAELQKL